MQRIKNSLVVNRCRHVKFSICTLHLFLFSRQQIRKTLRDFSNKWEICWKSNCKAHTRCPRTCWFPRCQVHKTPIPLWRRPVWWLLYFIWLCFCFKSYRVLVILSLYALRLAWCLSWCISILFCKPFQKHICCHCSWLANRQKALLTIKNSFLVMLFQGPRYRGGQGGHGPPIFDAKPNRKSIFGKFVEGDL